MSLDHDRRNMLKMSTVGFLSAAATSPSLANAASGARHQMYSVRDFGAVGDGKRSTRRR